MARSHARLWPRVGNLAGQGSVGTQGGLFQHGPGGIWWQAGAGLRLHRGKSR